MLINYNELERERDLSKSARHDIKAARFINELVAEELGFQIGGLEPGKIIHVANDSRWSLHELIVYCLKQTGPASLHFCTYAIKEFQARLFSNMLRDGVITELHALIDYRFRQHDPQAEQLLKACCTSHKWGKRLHGKVSVLKNESWAISIVGSANLTTNTSRDTMTITCDDGIANYWINWITKLIKDESKSATNE